MISFKQCRAILLSTGFLTMASCAGGPAVQEFPATANAKDEVQNLEADVDTARGSQTNVLSPTYFTKAQDAVKSAKQMLDKEETPKKTLHEVAIGRANLNQAEKFAALARANISDVTTARKQAIDAGAQKITEKEFKSADERLTEITKAIENNELDKAIAQRSALQLTYMDLELKSIKHTRLDAASETIQKAQKEGAKEFAPRSLAIAEKTLQDTEAYITANRHNDAEITSRSDEATQAADHLLKITRDAKAGDKTSAEDTALQMEQEKNKLSDKQGELEDKSVQLDNQIAANSSASKDLQAKNADLESDKAFNERFESARREFTANEAEVYKQGDALVIRLRGLEFPVAKADLKGESFSLLGKVQKIINDFGKGSVTVEGHTDSNGGKVLNEKLSAERAEAVKKYLQSTSEDQAMSIKSVGYGYQKPLATNKTEAGRAQNRRVDVLIRPVKM